tara:strand:- start:472 stop:819 length:348 start_codon:yes stop_codon:yes gene_type:complete
MDRFQQDWVPVTLTKKKVLSKSELQEIEKKKTAYNAYLKNNEELPKVKKTSIEVRKFIQKARTKRGFSQTDLAKKLSVNNSVIVNWENGKDHVPPNYISRLNKLLNVNIKKLEIF